MVRRCPSGNPLYSLARTKPVVLALRVTIGSVGSGAGDSEDALCPALRAPEGAAFLS